MSAQEMDEYFEREDFVTRMKNAMQVGVWTIELDPEQPPRMYGDGTMRNLLGLEGSVTPEDCYTAWYSRIFSSHLPVVERAIQELLEGRKVEITYPWMSPMGQLTYVRCGGELDTSYQKGVRFCGYHQDVTRIVLEGKERSQYKPVLSEYLLQVLCSVYDAAHLVDFRTGMMVPLVMAFPEVWKSGPISVEQYASLLEELLQGEEPYAWVREILKSGQIIDEEGQECGYISRDYKSHRNGVDYWYNMVLCMDQSDANMSMLIAFRDISENKKASKTIERLRLRSERDGLTSILNRMTIEDRIRDYLSQEQEGAALVLLDLDHFKEVNDNLGHVEGDVLLIETAEKLRQLCRKSDEIGRLGGDEFVMLLKGAPDDSLPTLMDRILEGLAKRLPLPDGRELQVSASIGVARFPQDGQDFQTLYQCADQALYRSKRKGRNCWSIYSTEDSGS